MARRGTFGRLPRAAPDLTNTLVALIREANAQEDSNYVDAWKNGGKVEGHGVDDEDLLKHFRKRRDALSPDDPLWDEWNNRVAQYDFSINESKMSLKFDQKKVSEQDVSNFYGKWLKRPEIQQDSEFYRHLLSQQAKWHNAANQGRAARSGASAYENHQKWVANITKTQTDPAKMAHDYVMQIAKAYDAVPDQQNATLEDVYETSTGWGRVLDITDNGKSDDPGIQKMMDEATARIRKTPGNEDFVFDKAHITDLDAKADNGYKLLKKNSMNKSERDHWTGEDGAHKFGSARIKQAEASTRLGLAADKWSEELDNCNGNPYCAKNATKTYRDTVARESKHLLAGQGETTLATQDNSQAKMILNTLRTLDSALAGNTIEAKDIAGMSGIAGAGIEETQADVIARGGKPGDRTPENIIGGVTNLFNYDIKNLDKPGSWVSVDPQADPQNPGQQLYNGDTPVFRYTTHGPEEQPAPGLFEVPAITTFTDLNTTGPASGPSGVPGPKTVMPRQFVRADEPNLVATTAGGDPVDAKNLTAVDAKGVPLASAPVGYKVLRTIGPDGNVQVLYRTGTGVGNDKFLIHTEPPLKPESDGGPKMTKVNGVMVPVFTAQPGKNAKNEPILTYDVTPITTGITGARNNNNPSGRYPLGTYENIGTASTAKAVNDIFNKGGTNAASDAAKLYRDYSNNLTKLPPLEQDKYKNDLYQLGKTVELRSRGVTQANLDNDYGELNQISPKQAEYRRQLESKGFSTQNGIAPDEIGRRVTLLENLDEAEARLGSRGAAAPYMDKYGVMAASQDPAWRLRQSLNNVDSAAIAKAKGEVFNPTISVSNIKIPGFTPPMMGASPADAARMAGIQAGLSFAGPGNFTAPTTAYAPPKPAGFANPAPARPNVSGGPDDRNNRVGTPAPSTLAPPLHPGKEADDKLTPPPTTYTPPTYKPPTAIKDWRLQKDLYGNDVYIGTGPNAGRKVLY